MLLNNSVCKHYNVLCLAFFSDYDWPVGELCFYVLQIDCPESSDWKHQFDCCYKQYSILF